MSEPVYRTHPVSNTLSGSQGGRETPNPKQLVRVAELPTSRFRTEEDSQMTGETSSGSSKSLNPESLTQKQTFSMDGTQN